MIFTSLAFCRRFNMILYQREVLHYLLKNHNVKNQILNKLSLLPFGIHTTQILILGGVHSRHNLHAANSLDCVLSRFHDINHNTKIYSKSSHQLTNAFPTINSRNYHLLTAIHHNKFQNIQQIIAKHSVKQSSFSPSELVEGCPEGIQPYLKLMRLDRPIVIPALFVACFKGTWLLYTPCLWSITLASAGLPDPKLLALFGAGAILMRGSGCIINDLWDKDFDAKVARTKSRPLACGAITPFQAISFLGVTLSMSLAILLQFNWYSVFLGASSMALVVSYPLMKRITYWPQIFLGLTFNLGALLGWSVVAGTVNWAAALPLYSAGLAWTLMYDTIYAHQDKEDDILIGVKSTALRLGDQTKPWLAGFSAAMVTGLVATGVVCGQTWPYYAGIGVVAAHLARQIHTVDLNNPDDCFAKFKSNRDLGLIFWLFIIAGNMLKGSSKTEDDETDKVKSDSNASTD